MAKQSGNDNQAKGFSGLDSMVSDVSKDVDHAERVSQSTQSQLGTAAGRENNQAAEPAASGSASASSVRSQPGVVGAQSPGASSESSGIKWLLGIVAFIFVIWLIGNSGKQDHPPYSPPAVSTSSPAVVPSPIPPTPIRPAAPRPSGAVGEKPDIVFVDPQRVDAAPRSSGEVGEKPPIGDGHVLDREQIRYCLTEKIRLDAIETIANASRNWEVDKFNGLVGDYNSRCGHFRYRRGSLESVRAEVEARRSQIEKVAIAAWVLDSTGLLTAPKSQ